MTTTAKNGTITITGLDELDKKIKQLSTDNPGFEKRLREAIRKVLGEVRAALQKDAQTGFQMKSDPRKAYKAVRYAVYKRLLGGQVNILDPRRVQKMAYNPPRKLQPKQRGGNRMKRSPRTQDLLEYYGGSRAFVLRFLNAGTEPRYNAAPDEKGAARRNGKTEEERFRFIANHEGRRYRGAIGTRNWFGPRSQRELQNAAIRIQEIIDRVINDEFV